MRRPKVILRISLIAAFGVLSFLAVLVFRKYDSSAEEVLVEHSPETVDERYPGLNLDNPVASYQVLRYVFEQGGDEVTRMLAINWLDQQTKQSVPLDEVAEQWLLESLDSNGHPDWDQETRFWIFNSSFNLLHLGSDQEGFTRLLQRLALEDPEKIMRLYALQHLELQRDDGRLTGSLAKEVHQTLRGLIAERQNQTAGTVLQILLNWEGAGAPMETELIEQALHFIMDSDCAADVRITAIHAAGEHALPSARILVTDTTQPTLVRKAAIACMGRYGEASDVMTLEGLSEENFRIAQAAVPAAEKIRMRVSASRPSEPVPL